MSATHPAYTAEITVGGYTWYCRESGKLWVTDPHLGYSLQYRHARDARPKQRHPGDAAGWRLCGNSHDLLLSKKLGVAMQKAGVVMTNTASSNQVDGVS